MTKAHSRHQRGLDFETREAARAAARRSGKSLEDWLDDVIRLNAGDVDDGHAEEEERIEAAARRLARSRQTRGGERRRWRDEAQARDQAPRRSQRDWGAPEAERDGQDEREEEAVKSVIIALAERLGRIESQLNEQPAANARPIRSALARLESRLERLSSEDRTADFEHALNGLDQRLADIARRLDEDARERVAKTAPPPSAVSAGMSGVSSPALEQGLRRGASSPRRPLIDAIAQITQRQRALDAAYPAPEAAAAPRFDALEQSIDSISRRLDGVRQDANERADQQLVVMQQVEALRRDVQDMAQAIDDLAPRASVAAIETALQDLCHRIESQRVRGVADDALAPAERIVGELRAVIKDLDPTPIVRNLHADVETIGLRLDRLQAPQSFEASVVRDLARQTHDIKQQLTALVARPLPLEKIETRLLDLTQRVDALTLASGASKADLSEMVKAIRSIVLAETGRGLETFNNRLEQVARKLDDVVAQSGAGRFEELGERIDELGKTLTQRIDRSVAHKSFDTAPLEQLVAKLAKKIDSALDGKGHAPEFEEIGRKIDRLETRIADRAPAEPIADRQFADLAQRIDLLHKTLAARIESGAEVTETAELRSIEELVRGLDKKIEAALGADARLPDLQALERQLAQLSYKIDRLDDPSAGSRLGALLSQSDRHSQLDEISERLERMQAALAQRVDEGTRAEARQSDLAALVEKLAARMNQAIDPMADAGALKSLESQIGALSQRLDRDDFGGGALAGIESKINDLVSRIEETHADATEAAEAAVRRATQEILREAAGVDAVALRETVERELSDIRRTQDESGQRTHETLIAVHETLERVVDRLAMFEDELSEIRVAPPAAPSRGRDDIPLSSRASGALDAPAWPPGEEAKNDDLIDFLLPLGGAAPNRREPSISGPGSDKDEEGGRRPSVQSDFIAAARRAAQQAAIDADAAQVQHARRAGPRPAKPAAAPGENAIAKIGAAILERKRPLLLGLGALVLLIGAYQVARVGMEGGAPIAPVAHRQQQEADAPAPSPAAETRPAAEKTPVAAEAVPAVKEPGAPPPRMIMPPSVGSDARGAGQQSFGAPLQTAPAAKPAERAANAQAPIDPTPTGAIGAAPLNSGDALAAIKSLATQGDASAQYEMGARLTEGRGAVRDPKAAAQWFEKAAAQSMAPAQYRLGSMYEKGVGVDRDYARARKWYQLSAEAGNARAMHNLAVLLAEGGEGKPDYTAAAEWFRKAAEYGVRDSQFNLAILYARGLGVAQSMQQSYAWFAAAADQGDDDARKKRDEIGARLDSKELAAAKALAGAFRAKELTREANDPPAPKGGWESVKEPAAVRPAPAKPFVKPKVSQL